jgi:hypothetical protein
MCFIYTNLQLCALALEPPSGRPEKEDLYDRILEIEDGTCKLNHMRTSNDPRDDHRSSAAGHDIIEIDDDDDDDDNNNNNELLTIKPDPDAKPKTPLAANGSKPWAAGSVKSVTSASKTSAPVKSATRTTQTRTATDLREAIRNIADPQVRERISEQRDERRFQNALGLQHTGFLQETIRIRDRELSDLRNEIQHERMASQVQIISLEQDNRSLQREVETLRQDVLSLRGHQSLRQSNEHKGHSENRGRQRKHKHGYKHWRERSPSSSSPARTCSPRPRSRSPQPHFYAAAAHPLRSQPTSAHSPVFSPPSRSPIQPRPQVPVCRFPEPFPVELSPPVHGMEHPLSALPLGA